MCGIYGSTRLYSEEMIIQKLNRVKFRGPDYMGYKVIDNRVILGHNRLSIIDLDSRANQPLSYKHVWITFNGEIYNYIQLKSELIKNGFVFYTESDTEVICAAYIFWGKECVKKFNGMFSFVIFDSKANILFGARDRFGKKPLYYIKNYDYFEFASQPSQLAIGNFLTVDERSISRFLVWHNIPEPDTIFQEVKKIQAGNSFTFNLSTAELIIEKYWEIGLNESSILSYKEAKKELKELLLDATKIRMVADVPVGIFLSGGIDSSLIASFAQSLSSRSIKTFSIKFNEGVFDESSYAAEIAQYLNTDHTTILCSYNEGLGLIENITEFFDEPFGDGSAIPTMLLAKHTRSKVTVALSGDGGDEGFLGYERYDWMLKFEALSRLPIALRRVLSYWLKQCDNNRLESIGHVINQEKLSEMYKSILSTTNKSFLLDKTLGDSIWYDEFLENQNLSLLDRISNYDLKSYLNNDILTKVDRASMAFSLETRSPLLDYRVIDFSRALPLNYKYNKGRKKIILRDILSEYMPKRLFERPKQGFGAPLNHWFRYELKNYVLDLLTDVNLKEIPNIDVAVVRECIGRHMRNERDYSRLIWDLLVLVQFKKHYRL